MRSKVCVQMSHYLDQMNGKCLTKSILILAVYDNHIKQRSYNGEKKLLSFHSQENYQMKFKICMLGSLFFVLCHQCGLEMCSSFSSGLCHKFFNTFKCYQKLPSSKLTVQWDHQLFLNVASIQHAVE